jgi:hypothetical protein
MPILSDAHSNWVLNFAKHAATSHFITRSWKTNTKRNSNGSENNDRNLTAARLAIRTC